jgi:adenylate kinase family enzyme
LEERLLKRGETSGRSDNSIESIIKTIASLLLCTILFPNTFLSVVLSFSLFSSSLSLLLSFFSLCVVLSCVVLPCYIVFVKKHPIYVISIFIRYNISRSDDNIDSILKRFKTYAEESLPIIDLFQKQDKCVKIVTDTSIDEVFESVKACLPTC